MVSELYPRVNAFIGRFPGQEGYVTKPRIRTAHFASLAPSPKDKERGVRMRYKMVWEEHCLCA